MCSNLKEEEENMIKSGKKGFLGRGRVCGGKVVYKNSILYVHRATKKSDRSPGSGPLPYLKKYMNSLLTLRTATVYSTSLNGIWSNYFLKLLL